MPQSRHLPITKFFVALAVPLMLSTAPTGQTTRVSRTASFYQAAIT